MRCPVCIETQLVMTDRQGIEIDYCPNCRGVWLDRGELDKIIERTSQPVAAVPTVAPVPPVQPSNGHVWSKDRRDNDDHRRYEDRRHYDDDDDYRHKGKYKKKRTGLLGELFDFD